MNNKKESSRKNEMVELPLHKYKATHKINNKKESRQQTYSLCLRTKKDCACHTRHLYNQHHLVTFCVQFDSFRAIVTTVAPP